MLTFLYSTAEYFKKVESHQINYLICEDDQSLKAGDIIYLYEYPVTKESINVIQLDVTDVYRGVCAPYGCCIVSFVLRREATWYFWNIAFNRNFDVTKECAELLMHFGMLDKEDYEYYLHLQENPGEEITRDILHLICNDEQHEMLGKAYVLNCD